MVYVACTLDWDNVTYVPWSCPNSESQPRKVIVYDDINGPVPLSYVYGKPGQFTPTYLLLPAPIHYLSLTTLSDKVRWLSRNLTLRVGIRSDNASRDIWKNSTSDLRKSFLHRLVNETLTRSYRRVARGETYLNGTIYIRNNGHMVGISHFVMNVYGEVPTYLHCDRSRLPLNNTLRGDTTEYSYTVCSDWLQLTGSHSWRGMLVFWTVLSDSLLIILFITLAYFSVQTYRSSSLTAQTASIPSTGLAPCDALYAAGGFPKYLTVNRLLCTRGEPGDHWRDAPIIVLILSSLARHYYLLLFLAGSASYVLSACMVGILAPYRYYDLNYLDDHSSIFAACWRPDQEWYVWPVFWMLLASFLFSSTALTLYSMRPSVNMSKRMLVLVFIAVGVFLALCLLFLANFLSVGCLTFAGFVFQNPYTVIGVLASVKVVVFDIVKVTRINSSISSDIASCSAAADNALQDLQKASLYKVKKDVGYWTASPCVPSSDFFADAEKHGEKLHAMHQRVVYLLCKKYIIDRKSSSRMKTKTGGSTIPNKSAPGEPVFYKHVTHDLQSIILRKFGTHIIRILGVTCLLSLSLGYLQMIFSHIGDLSPDGNDTSVIIPVATVIIGIVSSLNQASSKAVVIPAQKADAELYFLRLIAAIPPMEDDRMSTQTEGVSDDPDGSPYPADVVMTTSFVGNDQRTTKTSLKAWRQPQAARLKEEERIPLLSANIVNASSMDMERLQTVINLVVFMS